MERRKRNGYQNIFPRTSLFWIHGSGVRNRDNDLCDVCRMGICGGKVREPLHIKKETGVRGMNIVIVIVMIVGTSLMVQWASKL